MTTFKITIEYDGTRYSGWQIQKNARTVMGEIRKAALQIFDGEIDIQGAGRTDAGVHALAQVMHIKVRSATGQTKDVIKRRVNDLLPADIVILNVERSRRSFLARHDARASVYLYHIFRREHASIKRHVRWV